MVNFEQIPGEIHPEFPEKKRDNDQSKNLCHSAHVGHDPLVLILLLKTQQVKVIVMIVGLIGTVVMGFIVRTAKDE
jgi:hypothetical protein